MNLKEKKIAAATVTPNTEITYDQIISLFIVVTLKARVLFFRVVSSNDFLFVLFFSFHSFCSIRFEFDGIFAMLDFGSEHIYNAVCVIV